MPRSLSSVLAERGLDLRRDTEDGVVGGVASGLAPFLGVDVTVCRLVFLLAALGTWLTLPLYAVGWAVLEPGPSRPWRPGGDHGTRDLGFALVAGAGVLLAQRAGAGLLPMAVVGPLAVIVLGLAHAARRTGTDISVRTLRSGRLGSLRIAGGLLVAAAGVVTLLAANVSGGALRDGAVAGGLVLGGLLVVFGPWLYLLVRDLADERQARVRADERAAVAAHLHDSVLQTLALIQRSDDPEQIRSLARTQERDLRRWLYEDDPLTDERLRGAVIRTAEAIEDRYDVDVETVVVGDAPTTDQGAALVGAVHEALVNAARWSGEPSVSLYCEIGDDSAEAFVRDVGAGFDPATVGDGHRGIADSIRGRMRRAGGEVELTSAVGEGTEVRLRVEWPTAASVGAS